MLGNFQKHIPVAKVQDTFLLSSRATASFEPSLVQNGSISAGNNLEVRPPGDSMWLSRESFYGLSSIASEHEGYPTWLPGGHDSLSSIGSTVSEIGFQPQTSSLTNEGTEHLLGKVSPDVCGRKSRQEAREPRESLLTMSFALHLIPWVVSVMWMLTSLCGKQPVT